MTRIPQEEKGSFPRKSRGFSGQKAESYPLESRKSPDIFGGVVHDNQVSGAELGINIDDVRGMTFYNNVARDSGGAFPTSLGPRRMAAYNLSPLAHANHFALDGVFRRGLYARQSFVDAIPNWPQ